MAEDLTNLWFADNIVIFANSSVELGKIMEDLNMRSKEDSLEMNLKKIKILTNALETPVIVGNRKINYCPE